MPIPHPGRAALAPARILHVTEALGGGVEAALLDYARSTPQYRHALLFTRRGDFATRDRLAEGFDELIDAGTGVSQLATRYARTVRRLRPAVVHLHSAWAGLIGRAILVRSVDPSLVYSPHSFYFERSDIPAPKRVLASGVERVLAARGARVAALSPFEAAEALRLGSRTTVVPNVAEVPVGLRWSGRDCDQVVAVGRIAAQKDPDFLLAVKRSVDASLPHLRWTWLGAGEPALEQRLRDGGVEVTGWLPRAEVLQRVAASTVYLHTAAWEGSPIVLLETAAIGVPTVARSIPSLVSLGHDEGLTAPESVGERLVQTVLRPELGLRRPADRSAQTAALTGLYDEMIGLAPAHQPVRAVRQRVPVRA